jgi:hypothetical protein
LPSSTRCNPEPISAGRGPALGRTRILPPGLRARAAVNSPRSGVGGSSSDPRLVRGDHDTEAHEGPTQCRRAGEEADVHVDCRGYKIRVKGVGTNDARAGERGLGGSARWHQGSSARACGIEAAARSGEQLELREQRSRSDARHGVRVSSGTGVGASRRRRRAPRPAASDSRPPAAGARAVPTTAAASDQRRSRPTRARLIRPGQARAKPAAFGRDGAARVRHGGRWRAAFAPEPVVAEGIVVVPGTRQRSQLAWARRPCAQSWTR